MFNISRYLQSRNYNPETYTSINSWTSIWIECLSNNFCACVEMSLFAYTSSTCLHHLWPTYPPKLSFLPYTKHIQQSKHSRVTMSRTQSSSNTSYAFSSLPHFAYTPPAHCRAQHVCLIISYGISHGRFVPHIYYTCLQNASKSDGIWATTHLFAYVWNTSIHLHCVHVEHSPRWINSTRPNLE